MTKKELKFTKKLESQGKKWELSERFPLSERSYQPDFYLPEEDLYIELVGSPSTFSHNKHKYKEFMELYPTKKFIIVDVDGNPYGKIIVEETNKTIKKENKIICVKCGYEWIAKKLRPVKCPRCSSYDYDKEKK